MWATILNWYSYVTAKHIIIIRPYYSLLRHKICRLSQILNPGIESRDLRIDVFQSRNPGIEKWSGVAIPTRDGQSMCSGIVPSTLI